MPRWASLLLAAAVAGFAPPLQAQQPTAAKYQVVIAHYGFTPKRLVVPQGAVIAWTNRDAVRHDATSLQRSWATGTIGSGETRTITASKPGTFQYKCSFHPDMQATIVVEAPQ
jgi:plastocyanin